MSLSLKEFTVAVKLKVVPVTIGPARVSGVPSLDSCASTISNESSESNIAESNSTVQVTVIEDPLETMLSLLVTATDCGSGTVGTEYEHLESDWLIN